MHSITGKRITATELRDYVITRGYKAQPTFNDIQVIQDAKDLRITGYTLLGPRGNKAIMVADRDGSYSLDEAKLWCDGVDYATKKIAARKENRSI